MKRILSLALSALLICALTIPAAAADLPLWEEYGYESEEACIESWFGGDRSAYDAEVKERQERAQWEEDMAGEIAAFDANAYWESGECWQSSYYLSKEEFMEDWLLEDEEAFRACMLEDWLENRWNETQRARTVARTRAELGGVAGEIGVMLDGTYVKFPNGGAPILKNGRVMAPCGPLVEAFGGTVRTEAGELICTLGKQTIKARPGSAVLHLTSAAGVETELEMDVPCLYQNGHSYLPVRFLGQALECDVLWDKDYETAVLLQSAAVTKKLDASFATVNRLLTSMARSADKNYQTAVRMDAALTMLDSINGDKTYNLGGKLELLQSGNVLNFTMRMNLSALLDLAQAEETFSPAELLTMRAAARNLKMDVIYDGDEGMLYIKMPVIALLSEGRYPDQSWISMPVEMPEELRQTGAVSVGAMLYEADLQAVKQDYGDFYEAQPTPVLLYQNMTDAAAELATYLGDGCFAENGGWSVLHYDLSQYEAQLEQEYGEDAAQWASEFEKLDAELKIARSGEATYRILAQNRESEYDDTIILVDASGRVSARHVELHLLFKLKNQLNLTLQYSAETSVTDRTAVAAPAENERVIPADAYGEVPEIA